MSKRKRTRKSGFLNGQRVYLSGPMDFVASRAAEKKFGWRNRVGEFLHALGLIVFDPWNKPEVRGLYEYGKEDIDTTKTRELWTFEDTVTAAKTRAYCCGKFWETMHIDLRMVDTSDFTISYCPTNIYSVGTVHEIILCRQQRKPVLFVSPQVKFPMLDKLKEHLKNDIKASKLLEQLVNAVPVKENPFGIPSLWYMPLVSGENFFDGFGFKAYRKRFNWRRIPLDDREDSQELKRPLLPFLEKLNRQLPKKWDTKLKKYVHNDDWLLWDLKTVKKTGVVQSQVRIK